MPNTWAHRGRVGFSFRLHLSHCVNRHRFASDFGAFVSNFAKPAGEWKTRLKLCSVNSAQQLVKWVWKSLIKLGSVWIIWTAHSRISFGAVDSQSKTIKRYFNLFTGIFTYSAVKQSTKAYCQVPAITMIFIKLNNGLYFVWTTLSENTIVARGAWFSEVCSGRKTQETAVSKWVKCKMRNTCVWLQ